MKKRILITGGAGFIGSHLTEFLIEAGHHVVVVDNESTGVAANLSHVIEAANLTYLRCDLMDFDKIEPLLEDIDEVYHLAAAVGVALIADKPIDCIRTNVLTTDLLLRSLAERAAAGGQVKMFLASSSEVYGKNPLPSWTEDSDLVFGATSRPRWSYGASKAIDEFLALAYAQQGLPVVVGRFFNVIGPRQTGSYGMVVPRFVESAVCGKSLVVHDDGLQTRCFAHVRDVVEMVVRLMDTPATDGNVYNIGSDQPITIRDLARKIISIAGSPSLVEYKSYRDAYGADFEDIRHRVPELSKVRSAINHAPRYDLDDALTELVDWYRSRTDENV